ncbi:hypothetical protein COU36_05195 [Candidatus Micrarchaeota archaeon CG10_big_fil_rev_8_21_14_0_10_59_7]|nr:MAG: hypothetical protein COU36_05195 [Candidatus Micrarchaeota archaeon CG10_big_fil_rev_8_21_14_0_10_59_7]
MEAWLAGLYYIYLVLGSVSLGYLLLRLNYPDVRLFSQRKKLLYSLGAGAAIVVLSIAADFALSGGGAAGSVAGFALTFVFVFVLAAFLAVKVAAMAAKPDYVMVGIPRRKSPVVQKLLTIRRAVGDEKAPAAPMKALPAGAAAAPVLTAATTAQAITPASSTAPGAAVERRRYAQVSPQAGGFDFGKILGSIAAPFRGILAKKQSAPAVPGAPKRDAAKAAQATRETEFQQMITDIVKEKPGAQVFVPTETPGGRRRMYLGGGKAAAAAQKPTTEDEEMLAAVGYKQTAPGQAKPEQRRRWFVEKGRATAVTSNTDLQSFVHELYKKQQEKAEGGKPKQEDYGLLVQEIYTKTSKEEPKKEAPAKKEGKAERQAAAAEKKELTMADLFGQQPAKKAPEIEPKEGDLFRQLSAMASGTEAKAGAPKEDVHLVRVEASKSAGCPTCGSKSSRIVFCPYCGSGMCANCSPMIVPLPDSFTYTCPRCGEEVSVKKKAESAA